MTQPFSGRPDADLAADLDRGLSLPASWYTDPAVVAREHGRIFRRTWQYIGRAEQLTKPGDYVAGLAGDVPVVERLLDELRDLKGVSIVADPMPSAAPYGLDQPAVVITPIGKDGKPIGTVKLSKITMKPTVPEPGESSEPRTEYYAISTAGTAVYSVSDFSFSQFNKPPALFHGRDEATPTATPVKK